MRILEGLFSLLFAFILCAVTVSLGIAIALQKTSGPEDHTTWLLERIKEATSIKVGMSRADLLRISVPEGGFQTIPENRYVLKTCPLIKLIVEFRWDPNLDPRNIPDNDLKITKMSEPFLGYTIRD